MRRSIRCGIASARPQSPARCCVAATLVYELTEYGSELEDVVQRLGLWGAQSLGEPRPGEIMTADSMVMALRTTFVPRASRGRRLSFELRLGEIVVHARVDRGTVA